MIAIINRKATPGGCARAFVPADVLRVFRADILDETWCRRWILKKLHGDTPLCPECDREILGKSLQRFWLGARLKCDSCGKFFTALTGTILSGCHLSFQEMILLAFLIAVDVPDKRIADILEISSEGVRIWRNKFLAIEECSPWLGGLPQNCGSTIAAGTGDHGDGARTSAGVIERKPLRAVRAPSME